MNDHTNTLIWNLQTFAEPTGGDNPVDNQPTADNAPADNSTNAPTNNPPDNTQQGSNNQPGNGPTQSLLEQTLGNQPTSYDFTGSLPEGYELDEATSKAFGDICSEMKLTNEQANQIAAYGFQWQQQILANMQAQEQAAYAKEAEETKAFFGAKFDDTMKNVTIAVNSMEREYPGFTEALNKGGVGNNKAVLQVLAKVGTLLKEDPGVGGGSPAKANNNPYPNTNWDDL